MTGPEKILAAAERPVPEDDLLDKDGLADLSPCHSNVVAKQYLGDQFIQAAAEPQPPAAEPAAGADAPNVYADYAGRLVNLKGVGKSPSFSGEEADWPEWRFRFEN